MIPGWTSLMMKKATTGFLWVRIYYVIRQENHRESSLFDLALFMFGISHDLKINLFVYFRLLIYFHSIFGFSVFIMFCNFLVSTFQTDIFYTYSLCSLFLYCLLKCIIIISHYQHSRQGPSQEEPLSHFRILTTFYW